MRTHQGRVRLLHPLVAALLLATAGCSSLETGAPAPSAEAVAVPLAAPKTTGIESAAVRQHKQVVALYGGEYQAPATERFLNEVLSKLAVASDVPGLTYKVTILDSPIVNAFALPSGSLYVTRGLLALANDTSEVAAVMAHEIAHVTARHALQRAELEKRSDVISKAALVLENRDKTRNFQTYAQLSLASFSRQQEYEADEIGIHVIARAGYDPYGASRFLEALGRSVDLRQSLLGRNTSAEKPDILSTHPSTPERIAKAIAVARQLSAPGIGDVGRDRYLAAIDGIEFGDDPSEGVVRGHAFVHPKLGFTFVAPPNFALENSAQAVLGIADGGAEALRLDRVHVPAETTLESYIGSGWIDGLQAASVESLVINGFPAVMAVAKGQEWTFRLAAIRYGSEVYRMIFATRSLTDDLAVQFRASIESFRKISPDEAQAIKPTRIAVVTADAGATPDGLAARMAVSDKPLEFFLLLNGLESPSGFHVGERYKVVTE
ncbi:M48 family metalloprotease [Lichenihabitans sp. Uapishka_5]|uniref:M48 family metalloprotease n=1 Tax=Lichenihabitans sp. Uapishka_5 TaxID=3037302 RepID=UPI0029E7CE70|nr:M48 family metalloprotease [Lichenihabitans sp. Uapishka_5]MDX7949621.1 M48 family metalloprotease [Lichenihabitans sp. Uapishka_5]